MTINLSKRQSEILEWVLKGASNKQIAQRLGITDSTVKLHMSALLKKYGAQTRLQLSAYAKNDIPIILPDNLEALPFGWILTDGNSIKGIVTTKNAPANNWQAFYIKANDNGQD